MASYHCSIKPPLSRGKGQSLMAKAAYNARTEYRNERTGEKTKDYSYKGGLLASFVTFDPKRNAPEWAKDPERMLNAAIAAETRKDAREGQEIVLAFVDELGPEKNRWMLNDFLCEDFTRGTGRVAFVNIHEASEHGDQRNMHAHVLLMLREIGPDGFGKRLPALEPEDYTHIRQRWAERGAKELRKAGFELEADRYAEGWRELEPQRQAALERGDLAFAETLKNREATTHRGPAADAMERKGQQTERGNIHRDTEQRNEQQPAQDAAALKREIAKLELALTQYEQGWNDALTQAAIEKEKIERRFVEPQRERKPQPQREAANDRQQEKEKERKPLPAPELGKTQAEIRLARVLTSGPQSFANALEDRGFTLACVMPDDIQKDIDRLTKEWDEGRANPKTWMEHEGGYKALTGEVRESARRSFEEWQKRKEQGQPKRRGEEQAKQIAPDEYLTHIQKQWAENLRPDAAANEKSKQLEDYVKFVQRKWREGPKSQLENAPGELAVVTQHGGVYILTERNTGLHADELPQYLKGIDRGPLLSVTDAQDAMQDYQQHRQAERQHWQDKRQNRSDRQDERQNRARFGDVLILRAAETAMSDTHHGELTSAAAFRDALEKNRLALACPTPDEAAKSHRENAFAKEAGRYAPVYQAGEIVVMREPRNDGNTGGRVHKLDQTKAEDYLRCLALDKNQLQGIEATKRMLDDRAQTRQRAIDAADLRKARSRSRSPERGGLVAHQMWALQRVSDADQQRRELDRREYSEKQKRDSAEPDSERYRTDPEYRRQVQSTKAYKSPEEKKRDRENDVRAQIEQQDRGRG